MVRKSQTIILTAAMAICIGCASDPRTLDSAGKPLGAYFQSAGSTVRLPADMSALTGEIKNANGDVVFRIEHNPLVNALALSTLFLSTLILPGQERNLVLPAGTYTVQYFCLNNKTGQIFINKNERIAFAHGKAYAIEAKVSDQLRNSRVSGYKVRTGSTCAMDIVEIPYPA